MSRVFTVAAAQYPIDRLGSWQAYKSKLVRWVESAAREGAQLLVFPEYGGMELASLFGPEVERDLRRQLGAVAGLEADVAGLHADLARRAGVYILAASAPALAADGGYRNRARLASPEGGPAGAQDKVVMTRFERERWGVSGGSELRVFPTALGRIGVAICYDVEFPLLVRRLVEAGAELILAPSCTDTIRGYHRVRVGAQARALENQCLVVHSPTVGEAAWSPSVDVSVGAAGVYGPPDTGFPEDGVLARGRMNEAMWLFAELDLDRTEEVRARGQVLNHRDWPEQEAATVGAVPVGLPPFGEPLPVLN
jgi:predicted amidohydrolase